VLSLDLDDFSALNARHGEGVGDTVLQQVAGRLSSTLRASDTVARVGRDEFAVVLPRADLDGGILAAERLLGCLEPALRIEAQNLHVGASIGIAVFPEHSEHPDTLLRQADVAMYLAKTQRTGYAVYNPDQDPHDETRMALLGELPEAIERDELVLHYQPEVGLQDGRLVDVEALIRWQHPHYGLVQPDRFIPLAEQSGLIHPLSHWVLNAVLSQYDAWRRAGLKTTIGMNLSVRNLHDVELPALLPALLKRWRVPPQALKLEIPESAFTTNSTRSIEIVARLRSIGVRIAIDDFGTGYSSLAYLKRLDVDELKIDRSFVMDMATNDNDLAIVGAAIDLGHTLGLQVVAEGVEDAVTWDLLASLGCDRAQGHYVSRPLPAETLAQWVSQHGGRSPDRAGAQPPRKPEAEVQLRARVPRHPRPGSSIHDASEGSGQVLRLSASP